MVMPTIMNRRTGQAEKQIVDKAETQLMSKRIDERQMIE